MPGPGLPSDRLAADDECAAPSDEASQRHRSRRDPSRLARFKSCLPSSASSPASASESFGCCAVLGGAAFGLARRRSGCRDFLAELGRLGLEASSVVPMTSGGCRGMLRWSTSASSAESNHGVVTTSRTLSVAAALPRRFRRSFHSILDLQAQPSCVGAAFVCQRSGLGPRVHSERPRVDNLRGSARSRRFGVQLRPRIAAQQGLHQALHLPALVNLAG